MENLAYEKPIFWQIDLLKRKRDGAVIWQAIHVNKQ